MTESRDWTDVEERGHPRLFQFFLYLHRIRFLNYWLARLFLYPIMTFFYLSEPELRQFSRTYLDRLYATDGGREALGDPPDHWDVYRHFLSFGRSIFDRFSLWLGHESKYRIISRGEDVFQSCLKSREGGLLLSFHVGNFDLMRFMAQERGITINIVAYWENAPFINNLLERVDPDTHLNVFHMDPGDPAATLELKECVDRGEFVAILGDRTSTGAEERTISVEFLGETAAFPQGPYILAGLLGCPVLVTYSIRTGPGTYEIYAEKLASEVRLSKNQRRRDLQKYARRYAQILEKACIRAPYQWFNFFDFWSNGAS